MKYFAKDVTRTEFISNSALNGSEPNMLVTFENGLQLKASSIEAAVRQANIAENDELTIEQVLRG